MVCSKVLKLVLDDHGSYLGMEKGCFIVKDKNGNVERYPLFEKEIGEVILKSGNTVSTGALASLGFWDIDVLITTQRGRPVAMLRSLEDDSHVKTRLCQYEAVNNGKGLYVAKELVLSKIESQNIVLQKYGLEKHDLRVIHEIERIEANTLDHARRKLIPIEAKYSKRYFSQIFELSPEKLRPSTRETFLAYDGVNNTFNLAYEFLKWKVHTYRMFVFSMGLNIISIILSGILMGALSFDQAFLEWFERDGASLAGLSIGIGISAIIAGLLSFAKTIIEYRL